MKKTIFLATLLAAASVQADEYDQVRSALEQLVPGIEVDSIAESPIPGYAQVLIGAQLVYVSMDGDYLLDGQIIEVATRRNLSDQAKGAVRQAKLAGLTDQDMITFPATGERKHRLYVFTDIDCGYCRRLHQQMAEYNDMGIEVNYMMFPRAGIGSESYNKAVSVFCADDQQGAMTAAKAGETPPPKQCDNPVEMNYELGKELGVTGTPALVTTDGTLMPGYVPPAQLAERLESISQSAE